ncbi:hypothetical protein OQA88_12253 [Cercophora sp. LCS_1]
MPLGNWSSSSSLTPSLSGYGIHVWVDKSPTAPGVVDVVAIHGLNGHYENTWTAPTTAKHGDPVNWLKDLLPLKLPDARIMSFSYNSKVQFSKSTADVFAFADQLLEQLLAVRRGELEGVRPVIFICHSLGGIVCKQAVVRAMEDERYRTLRGCLRGIMFFGTPHRGSDVAGWATVLGGVLKVGMAGTSTNTGLVKDLERGSRVLEGIGEAFVNAGRELVVFSFYETERLEGTSFLVVDKQSATLGWPGETKIPIDGDHRAMCRFSHVDESRFRPVWTSLCEMASVKLVGADPKATRGPSKSSGAQSSIQLSTFRTSDYEAHKARNPPAVLGTCIWILEHEKYQAWVQTSGPSLLWLSADPGCGKSVLASFLVDHYRSCLSNTNICYFFFKADNAEQNDATFALSAALHQLYSHQPELIEVARKSLETEHRGKLGDISALWDIFVQSTESPLARPTICVFDGLDECDDGSRRQLTKAVSAYFAPSKAMDNPNSEKRQQRWHKSRTISGTQAKELKPEHAKKLKLLVTSRPENSIKVAFDKSAPASKRPREGKGLDAASERSGKREAHSEKEEPSPNADVIMMRLRGEDETHVISSDIELVVKDAIYELADKGLDPDLLGDIEEELVTRADRTFLWVMLIMQLLKELAEEGASRREMDKVLNSRGIDAVYTQLLETRKDQPKARKMLSIILAATRPLTVDEMSIALAIRPDYQPFDKPQFGRRPSPLTFDKVEYDLVYPFENHIKSLCGNFVRIIRGKLYLVHQTAREYLLDEASIIEFHPPKKSLLDRLWLYDEEDDDGGLWGSDEEEDGKEAEEIKRPQSSWHHSISHLNANGLLLEICVTYLHMLGKKSRCAVVGKPSRKTAAFLEYAANSWTAHFRAVSRKIDSTNDLRYYRDLCHPSFPGYKAWVSLIPYGQAIIQTGSAISADQQQDALVEMLRLEPGADRMKRVFEREPVVKPGSVLSSNPGALSNFHFPVGILETGLIGLDLQEDGLTDASTRTERELAHFLKASARSWRSEELEEFAGNI